MDEKQFINEAIRRGIATFDQIQECVAVASEMARSGVALKIWEVLVLKGVAKQEHVDAVLSGSPLGKSYPFGPFVIHGKIGEGGMGAVYRASKPGDPRLYALKVLPDRFSQGEFVKRFEREARIAITLNHPNLVKGYEKGKVGNRYYYAMELVAGKVLSGLIKERGRVDETAAIQIGLQIGEALKLIHANGLVHRDVKPDNVIMSEDGVAKLMDFGLVKSSLQDATILTQSGLAVGTPNYMSPEQFEGKDVDPRSDVYSLGATLFHLATGERPFRGTTAMDIYVRQTISRVPDPRQVRPDLSEGISLVIQKMMAVDPKDRYGSMDEVMDELRLVKDRKPPRQASVQTKHRSIRSMPVVVLGAAGLVMLVLVVALVALPDEPPPEPAAPPAAVAPREPTAEEEFEKRLALKAFNDAHRIVKEGNADPSRIRPLQEKLDLRLQEEWSSVMQAVRQECAAGRWERAREQLKKFSTDASDIDDVQSRVERELVEVARAESLAAEERDADASFKILLDSIRLFEERGDWEDALKALEGAQKGARERPMLLRKIEARMAAVRERIAALPKKPETASVAPAPQKPEDLEPHWKQACSDFEAQRYAEARATLTELIRKAPKDARLHALRARCFAAMGNLQNARTDLSEALALDPQNSAARVLSAFWMLDEGKVLGAIKGFTAAISADPSNVEAYRGRAKANSITGQPESCLRDLDEAARLRPELKEDPEILGLRLRSLLDLNRPEQVMQEGSEWIARNPRDIQAYLLRSEAAMNLGKFKEAESDAGKALALDPGNAEASARKEEAVRAGKPAPRPPDRPAPRPSKLTSTQLKKKIEASFNASQKSVSQLADGRYRVVLTYDLSKKEQADDFEGMIEIVERTSTLKATAREPNYLRFRAPLVGDFLIKMDVYVTGGNEQGLLLYAADPIPAYESMAMGIGAALRPATKDWKLALTDYRPVGTKTLGSERAAKADSNGRGILALKREGTAYTGGFGSATAEAIGEGQDRFRLRMVTWNTVRIHRIEIQGTLDPDWVRETYETPEEPSRPLWNGRDLKGWELYDHPIQAVGTAMSIVTEKSMAHAVYQEPLSSRSARLDLDFEVDEDFPGAMVGFLLQQNRDAATLDGSLAVLMSDKSLYLYQHAKGFLAYVGKSTDKPNGLRKGARHHMELLISGKDVIVRVRDMGEWEIRGIVQPGTLRPGILAKLCRIRVFSFSKREDQRAAAVVDKPLWNGDLSEWIRTGETFGVRDGSMVVAAERFAHAAHRSLSSAKSARFEMAVEVDELLANPSFGLAIYGARDTPPMELPYAGLLSGGRLSSMKVEKGKWVTLKQVDVGAILLKKEYVFDMIVDHGTVTIRLGAHEVVIPSALDPDAEFRPGFWVQNARARITRFVRK